MHMIYQNWTKINRSIIKNEIEAIIKKSPGLDGFIVEF
jgi:hypothetical protein